MQELEKILEEMSRQLELSTSREYRRGWRACKDRMMHIVRKHINDGWIPVEEQLPEVNRTPEEDDECPEFNVTIRGAEEATTLKYSPADHTWFDKNGYVYDVIAWRPMPEVYRPADKTERSEQKCFCGCVL